jgi:hypothetical protein
VCVTLDDDDAALEPTFNLRPDAVKELASRNEEDLFGRDYYLWEASFESLELNLTNPKASIVMYDKGGDFIHIADY